MVCLFAFLGLMTIWYHIGRKQKDLGQVFLALSILCWSLSGGVELVFFNSQGAFAYGQLVSDHVTIAATGDQIGGVNLTSLAFESTIPGSSYVLSIAVVLFAFSTIISWSYYGLQSWTFLLGRSLRSETAFEIIFLTFTILGSAITLEAVIKFSDAMILALVFPNLTGLLILFPVVKIELRNYLIRISQFRQRA